MIRRTIVAGIGCRRNASRADIEAAVEAALAACGLGRADIVAFATSADKIDEPGIAALVAAWNKPLEPIERERLTAVAGAGVTRSSRVMAAKGVHSVAEASALAAAGTGARLLGARVTNATAACAIADGLSPEESDR